jgi:hypothetical protein
MNKGEQIYQIKQALKKLFSLTEDKVQSDTEMMEKKSFTDFEVQDGTKLTTPAASLEVGVDIFGIDLDGNQFPLNNADYKLTDGRIVTVEDNKVKAISEPSDIEESPVSEADLEKVKMQTEGEVIVEEKDKEEMQEEGEMISTEERIGKLEEVLGKVLMAIDEIKKAHEEMMGKVQRYSDEPAIESIKMSKGIGSTTDPKEFAKRKNMAEVDELRTLIKQSRKENNNIKI